MRIGRAALENWARFRGGREEVASARIEMLEEIERHGRLTGPPEWMTSQPPGIEAWVALPGGLWLGLAPAGRPGFRWLARNTFAPKNVRRQAGEREPLRRARLEGKELERVLALSPQELAQEIHLTEHAGERFAERAGANPETAFEELREAIAANGRVVARAPEWADAAGTRGAALLCRWREEELALPLQPNTHRGCGLVATTVIPRRWSEEGLDQLSADRLAGVIAVSSNAARVLARRRGIELEQARIELERSIARSGRVSRRNGVIRLDCELGALRLRAATDTGAEKPWIACELLSSSL